MLIEATVERFFELFVHQSQDQDVPALGVVCFHDGHGVPERLKKELHRDTEIAGFAVQLITFHPQIADSFGVGLSWVKEFIGHWMPP